MWLPHFYIMKVIPGKLKEELWAYIITDAEDHRFVEQELAKTIDIYGQAVTKHL